jgi:hypothetical protein
VVVQLIHAPPAIRPAAPFGAARASIPAPRLDASLPAMLNQRAEAGRDSRALDLSDGEPLDMSEPGAPVS